MAHKSDDEAQQSALPSGWIYADLFLALVVLVIVAVTIGLTRPSPPANTAVAPTPTATPTATPTVVPTATPTPLPPTATPLPPTPTPQRPPLSLTPVTFTITVDYAGLLAAQNGTALQNTEQAIRQQLANETQCVAGLVLTSSGTPTDYVADLNEQDNVATQVNVAMQALGNQGFVFQQAVYHHPLTALFSPFGYVSIEIYLYVYPAGCGT